MARDYSQYIDLLKAELRPAMGCTEPIAVAFVAAKAREILGKMPTHIEMYCSGNIIKNVKAVTVPNSDGGIGIEVAAILGAVGGDPKRELEVLSVIKPEHIEAAKGYKKAGLCHCNLTTGVNNLYIRADMEADGDTVSVEVIGKHTYITKIIKNGDTLFEQPEPNEDHVDKSFLNLHDIYDFAKNVDIELIRPTIERQLDYNDKISEEGLDNPWGSCIGRTILATYGTDNWRFRAMAKAAAGSDARMNGCALPVVINSGSGNQGIAVSMPLLVYAREYDYPKDELIRALAFANLISLLQKKYIGDLSAYCGAACAGCASVGGIAFLNGDSFELVGQTIINAACAIGGMVCDGAKSSCAAKIAASVSAGFLAYEQAKAGNSFLPGQGMIVEDMEQTIANIGRMGRDGMAGTDVEILNIMLRN